MLRTTIVHRIDEARAAQAQQQAAEAQAQAASRAATIAASRPKHPRLDRFVRGARTGSGFVINTALPAAGFVWQHEIAKAVGCIVLRAALAGLQRTPPQVQAAARICTPPEELAG